MGLRATLASAVSAAFTALGDIPLSVTYRRTSSSYNTATGSNTVTNTDYTITKAVLTRYENMEIDKVTVLGSDLKLIFQTSGLSVTPNIATDIVIASGKTYNIVRVNKDPAGATYSLQLRSPS